MALDCSPEAFSPQNEFYLLCSYCSNLWHLGWGQFWPHRSRGIIWIKLIKVHKEMLHTKNQSSIPSSFREKCLSWSSLFLCSNMWPLGWGLFWPQGHHVKKCDNGPLLNTTCQISKLKIFHFQRWRMDSGVREACILSQKLSSNLRENIGKV